MVFVPCFFLVLFMTMQAVGLFYDRSSGGACTRYASSAGCTAPFVCSSWQALVSEKEQQQHEQSHIRVFSAWYATHAYL